MPVTDVEVSQYHTSILFRGQTVDETTSSATAKNTARPSCLVGVFYDISREKIRSGLINHFYVIGHESYRIQRNNAK